MSTTQPIHALLTEQDHQKSKEKTNKVKILIAILLAFITIIGVIVIITYTTEIWPFEPKQESKPGIYGKYPVWGGNIQNQQIALNSLITNGNINDIQSLCIYNGSETDRGLIGYVTVDNNNNGYFGDTSGYINSINLNSCKLNWKKYINKLLNYNGSSVNIIPNTATLYQTSNAQKGIIFGTRYSQDYPIDEHGECFVIALNIIDGSILWINKLGLGIDNYSTYCIIHGFMIDDHYAYGGMSSGANMYSTPNINNRFIGRMNKIDINNGDTVDEWYTFPKYNNSVNHNIEGSYSGAGVWPISAIIDNYVVFGTGNLYTYPRRVQQCLLGNTSSIPMDTVYEYNLCEEDMRNKHLNWRCLEQNVYTDSLVVLDKDSFNLEVGIPFAGVDTWNGFCDWMVNETIADSIPDCPKIFGPDADAVSIATYHDSNGIPNVAVGQKSGQFYVIEIPTGTVKISKKVGPWSYGGGSAPFSMAIDETNMIAIFSLIGGSPFPPDFLEKYMYYRYKLGDNTVVCSTGSIHAIDLNTGYTLWNWINPYGKRGNLCNDSKYDEYTDVTINGTCEYSINRTAMLPSNETVTNVIIPPIDDILHFPLYSKERAFNTGPVTISNDMVFISSLTGDIFIHNILNGDFIKRIQCPDYKFNETHWNRNGIRSGITVYDDRIVFYCGANLQNIHSVMGNQVISMKLT